MKNILALLMGILAASSAFAATQTISGRQIKSDAVGESNLNAANSPTDEYCLTYESGTLNFEWQTCSAGGGGDVVGPVSSTNNALATFDGTTGKLLKDGLLTMTQPASINTLTFPATGDADDSIVFDSSPLTSLDAYFTGAGNNLCMFAGSGTACVNSNTNSFRVNSSFIFMDNNTPIRWGANSAGTTISGSDATSELFLNANSGTTEVTVSDGAVALSGNLTLNGGDNLSTYDEGTTTPTVTLVGGAGNTVPVYSTNTERFVRIGKLTTIDILLTGDGGAEGAGTGQINVALPFAASASFPAGKFPCGNIINSTTSNVLHCEIAASASTVQLYQQTAVGTIAAATGDDQNNATREIRIHLNYEN